MKHYVTLVNPAISVEHTDTGRVQLIFADLDGDRVYVTLACDARSGVSSAEELSVELTREINTLRGLQAAP
jgi:hypothetical protein